MKLMLRARYEVYVDLVPGTPEWYALRDEVEMALDQGRVEVELVLQKKGIEGKVVA